MIPIAYSRHYNIGLLGLERLHPFDSRKYGRAWRVLRREFGSRLKPLRLGPQRPAARDELRLVHSDAYLRKLRDSKYVAQAIEVPPARRLPARLLDWCVLRPMRYATHGTILAAEASLESGLAINLGGGFHHAKPEHGEGFCVYADIGIAVQALRQSGRLSADARIAYVDADAHQGNGVCHTFLDDSRVFIFDIYNRNIYPFLDTVATDRIDCRVDLPESCDDRKYLQALRQRLPPFLDSISQGQNVGLAIYNAGTDIVAGDPLGKLAVSAGGVLERDLFVVQQLRDRNIPAVMLLSGGYTSQSFMLVAESVKALIQRYDDRLLT